MLLELTLHALNGQYTEVVRSVWTYRRHDSPVHQHWKSSSSASDHGGAQNKLAQLPETAGSAGIAARTSDGKSCIGICRACLEDHVEYTESPEVGSSRVFQTSSLDDAYEEDRENDVPDIVLKSTGDQSLQSAAQPGPPRIRLRRADLANVARRSLLPALDD